MSNEIVTLTKDKVRSAAASCPDAARVLKMLVPEAFKAEPIKVVMDADNNAIKERDGRDFMLIVCPDGRIHLESQYDWTIKLDSTHSGLGYVLVPTRRQQ